jgi:hypothetical protein
MAAYSAQRPCQPQGPEETDFPEQWVTVWQVSVTWDVTEPISDAV